MRTVMVMALAGILLTAAAGADEILLKNGNVIVGKILSEDGQKVTIRVMNPGAAGKEGEDKYIQMTFQKKRVRRVTRDASFFQPVSRSGGEKEKTKTEGDETPTEAVPATPAVTPTPATGDDGGEKKAGEPPSTLAQLDPALKAKIDSLISSLSTATDMKKREDIENQLVSLGEDAGPSVILALKAGGKDLQRIALIRVLSNTQDKRAVRVLLEQLKGSDKNKRRMRHAWYALKRITGQNYPFNYDEDSNKKRLRQVQVWEKWFEGAKETFPEQVGYEEKKAP